jgi:hypothetical protein
MNLLVCVGGGVGTHIYSKRSIFIFNSYFKNVVVAGTETRQVVSTITELHSEPAVTLPLTCLLCFAWHFPPK